MNSANVTEKKTQSNGVGKFCEFDEKLSASIVQKLENSKTFFQWIALTGNNLPWITTSLLFLAFGLMLTRLEMLTHILTVLLAGLFATIVKYLVRRKRPCGKATKQYVTKGDFYSFPSGHATRVACLAVLSVFLFPLVSWLFIIWALGVGIARIVLKVHYVGDIIAGYIVGSIVAVPIGFFFFDIAQFLSLTF